MVYPHLTHTVDSWGKAQKGLLNMINKVHKKVIRCFSRSKYNDPMTPLLKKFHFLLFDGIHEIEVLKIMHDYRNGNLPLAIGELFTRNQDIHTHNTRQQQNPHIVRRRTKATAKNLVHIGPKLWANLPVTHRENRTRLSFAKKCKTLLLERY